MKTLKQFAIIFILFLTPFITYSQQQISFNKLYNPDNTTSGGSSILTKGHGYIIQAIEWNVNLYPKLIFIELDSIGNQIKFKKFALDSTYYYCSNGSMTHTYDGGYCFAGDINIPSKFLHYMIRFNKDLDTLWTKTYEHDTNFQCVTQVCETTDKGFVLVGEKNVNSAVSNVLIIKTDWLGNKLWEKTISTGNVSRAWQVKETSDKGFLIEGYKYYIAQGKGCPFILKTDSVGNFLWDNFPNCPNYNQGGAIAITKEGDYLFAYGYGISLAGNTTDYINTKINIIKYNIGGGVIWNRIYDTITTNLSVARIDTLPNGDFYVLSDVLVSFATSEQYNARLIKFNSNGDSLWTQRFSYTDIDFSVSLLYDGVTTNDDAFIACGYVLANPGIVQQIWVVKTDSNGYAPGMHFLGMNELSKENNGKVYPNPATNQTTIAYSQLKEEGDIHIYNMLGQIVYEEKIAKGSSQTKLSIQHLKAGLYKVIVREKGVMIGEVSLVKE